MNSFQGDKVQHKVTKYRAQFHSTDYKEGDWEGQPLREKAREGGGVGNEGKNWEEN